MEIYRPKGRAREYSPLALNDFQGCDHNCDYCYVPRMVGRWNKNYQHGNVINPSLMDFQKIEKSAKKWHGCNEQILLSFTGDPYCNSENGETRIILEILNKYGHKVSVLTKNPEKALRDIDIMKQFGERFKMGSTLTFDNDADSLQYEPGAPSTQSKIDSLKEFERNGIKTWVSFEPVIVPSQSLNLLEQVVDFIDHVKIGKVNNYMGLSKQINWTQFIKDSV